MNVVFADIVYSFAGVWNGNELQHSIHKSKPQSKIKAEVKCRTGCRGFGREDVRGFRLVMREAAVSISKEKCCGLLSHLALENFPGGWFCFSEYFALEPLFAYVSTGYDAYASPIG